MHEETNMCRILVGEADGRCKCHTSSSSMLEVPDLSLG